MPKVSTGVAAFNIEGKTIRISTGMAIGYRGKNVPGLGDKICAQIRNKFS